MYTKSQSGHRTSPQETHTETPRPSEKSKLKVFPVKTFFLTLPNSEATV